MKRFFGVLFIVVTMVLLVACGEKQVVKIGIMQANATEGQQKYINDYLNDVIKKNFNVEFIFSESLSTSEADISFLESLTSAGAKGVISFVNNQTEEALAMKLKELELYFIAFANPNDDQIAAHRDNPYYLGGVGQQNSEIDGMYQMTKALLEGKTGQVSLLLASGGDAFGIQMFVDRVTGVMNAVDEYKAKATGNDVVVDKLVGFPSIPGYVANAATKLADKPDIVIATMSGELFLGQIAQIANYNPKFGVNGSIAPALLEGIKSGSIDYLAAINPQIVAMVFAIIYNVATGHEDFIPANQFPARFSIDYKAVIDEASMEQLTKEDLFTISEISSVIVESKKSATYSKLLELIRNKY